MRPEKKYLLDEARATLSASEHVFFVNFTGVTVANAADFRKARADFGESFTGVTVANAADFRKALAEVGAQYHIAKNSIIALAAKELNLPDFSDVLQGPTGIISGGEDPASVAKAVVNFFKDREKATIKIGILGEKLMTKADVEHLGSLPSLPELRAQFLSLLSTPAKQMVRVLFVHAEKLEGKTAE